MSDWIPPTSYPDLKGAPYIAFDCETKDPNLLEMGPGDRRKDGYVVGISIAVPGFTGYYPIAHEGGGNLPRDTVIRWLKKQLSGNEPKIGANIIYDLGWLDTLGIQVGGVKHDVQIAEALIYELYPSYRLEAIGQRYFGEGKDEALMREEAAKHGWDTEKKVKQNLWRLHSKFVGPYGARDAELTMRIHEKQIPKIKELELEQVYSLECRLTDVLHKMRIRGMPISYEKAERAMKELTAKSKEALETVNAIAGRSVDIWSNQAIQGVCDERGWEYPRTEKGNPSFTSPWLATQNDPFYSNLLLARQLDRSATVFIEGKILKASVNGRIHPNFKQTRRDDGGTKSGRMSSSNPNMQQVPARHPILAPMVRGIFIADEGSNFGVFDYSQQEPRVTVHYAYLRKYPGAEKAHAGYMENVRTDYHQLVADLMGSVSGRPWSRKVAKPINLGLAYGMGIYKLAQQLNVPLDEAKKILAVYHQAVPFIRALGDEASRQARRRGYIRTIMGRRRHFPGGQFVHKALNSAIQGSSADMLKQALVDVDDAGYTIYNTVHDEIDLPVEIGNMKQVKEIREIMLNAVELTVPLALDAEIGPSWGECELVEE